MRAVYLALLLLPLSASAVRCASARPSCTTDSMCNNMNPFGFWTTEGNGSVACSSVAGTCCEGMCMDGRVEQCLDPGVRCWTNAKPPKDSSDVVCGKPKVRCQMYQKACGASCYDPSSTACSSFTTSNGVTVYFLSADENLDSTAGFFAIAIPLLFLVALIIALVVIVVLIKGAFGGLATGGKVLVVLSVVLILLSLFCLFHAIWPMGIVAFAVAFFTILAVNNSVGAAASPLEEKLLSSSDVEAGRNPMLTASNAFTIVTLAAQLVAVVYLLNPFPDQDILGLGDGIMAYLPATQCNPEYESHFTYDTPRMNNWLSPIINPSANKWGYCSNGFKSWELTCGVLCILLSLCIWVGHTVIFLSTLRKT
eukprot:TRINITY_DN693_c0_g1_i1.p1 TRINITY_DN693_c0_g1~~TRINITY_DN693_c0_g1_i1.p1  ORF type:complete len:367 (-),score=46.17 TRINITY_DN693_c0_g1_i1:29-1129(-)